MREINYFSKNSLLYFKYNICYLLKEKNIKNKFIMVKGNKILNIFKKIYIYNIYNENYYIDFFLVKYNIIKNI
jgi:hypothetical protein